MARSWIHEDSGAYHIISRAADKDIQFSPGEKEYFLKLMEIFSKGFYVDIHSFCVMDNHFHVLLTSRESLAYKAGKDELFRRYKQIYGKTSHPPPGSYQSNGEINVDEDGGVERLRRRLGSVSRFVQELKQTFSRWYNRQHDRKGYLWTDRFKGVIVDIGEAQLSCSAYIDLNPIRAGIVQRPEDYRWSSMGLRARNPKRAMELLISLKQYKVPEPGERIPGLEEVGYNFYRCFVYESGGMRRLDQANISPALVEEVKRYHGKLGIGDLLKYRVRNFSEGIAIGSLAFIQNLQTLHKRKFIRPRSVIKDSLLFSTRSLGVVKSK
jgi:REP element-mobilizing transposase RayT